MSAVASVECMRPAHVPRLFRFLWIGQRGPVVKCFTNINLFLAYVADIECLCGSETVDFKTPFLAVGVLA